jgi:hypothetical protein
LVCRLQYILDIFITIASHEPRTRRLRSEVRGSKSENRKEEIGKRKENQKTLKDSGFGVCDAISLNVTMWHWMGVLYKGLKINNICVRGKTILPELQQRLHRQLT